MKNSIKTLLGAASLLAMAAPAAYADDAPAPEFAVSAAVDLQSDYRFRGISQNDKQPAAQGTVNLTGPDGFYAGVWASKIDWDLDATPNNPSLEVDEYAGKHTDLWGTDLNVEAYYYSYPDARTYGGSKASYFEGIFQLSHVFGPLTTTATWAYSPEFSLGGGTGNYIEGTAAFAINDWLSVSGDVGHQWVQGAKGYLASVGVNENGDYSHFDVGATATYKSLSLDVRYMTTDMDNAVCSNFYMATANACSGGFVATLTYSVSSFPW